MLSALTKYMPRWLMVIIATALVLATVVGSNQDSAEAIDPADADTVYIADGTDFADALMGATIASLNTSPMLGVAPNAIPSDTSEELDRLTNDQSDLLDTIYIFGGTAAVSATVETQLGQWANSVQRIEGDSRWGTYQAISQMLPSAVDEAVHAQEADHATTADSATEADNADTLDGKDSGDFALSDQACTSGQVVTGIAADGTPTCAADQVDGGNADTLDGNEASAFATADHRHVALFDSAIYESGSSLRTTSTSYSDMTPITASVTIPDGHTGVIVARFQAESKCFTSGSSGGCLVRLLRGTTEMPPSAFAKFDDTAQGSGEEVQSMQRISPELSSGTYTVKGQHAVTNTDVTFDMWNVSLTLEVKLTS